MFCFQQQFPKGMLLRWFVALYEADIIQETVFLKWKEDVNDAYPGKGKALFQASLLPTLPRVGKKPVLKKTSPVGFFGFFGFLWVLVFFIFAQKREFLGFFRWFFLGVLGFF